jgi:hypothetical protein
MRDAISEGVIPAIILAFIATGAAASCVLPGIIGAKRAV